MSQVSAVMRRYYGGYMHWCPGCQEFHPLPDRWTFDGNVDSPTFHPSFKQTLHNGIALVVCHYWIKNGVIDFCPDSWHALKSTKVPMPALPTEME